MVRDRMSFLMHHSHHHIENQTSGSNVAFSKGNRYTKDVPFTQDLTIFRAFSIMDKK